jgi:hypothetical protein
MEKARISDPDCERSWADIRQGDDKISWSCLGVKGAVHIYKNPSPRISVSDLSSLLTHLSFNKTASLV